MKKIILFTLLPLFGFSQFIQIGNDIDAIEQYEGSGWSVSMSSDGSIVAVGAPSNDGFGTSSGSVIVYQNVNDSWVQLGNTIYGENAGDQCGWNLSINDSGNILAISSVGSSEYGSETGHVRVFENISGSWTQIGAKIVGYDFQDRLGYSLSLNSAGNIIVIGAYLYDISTSDTSNGLVQVFQNNNGTWAQIGSNITGNDNDLLGGSVSISNDGNIIAASSITGIRTFENTDGSWTQIGSDIDQPGLNTARLNGNGNIISVGTPYYPDSSGSVRVYENISGTWTQIGSDILGEAIGDQSGDESSLALSNGGNVVAIGARYNDGNGDKSGHVRIYENISGTWTQIGDDIDGENSGDWSGWGLSLSNDGDVLAIGAYRSNLSGHVRVYRKNTLSIENITFETNFNIYPNPSYNQTNINLGKNYKSINLNIYDAQGTNINEKKYTNISSIILDTQDLSSGIYFIKISTTGNSALLKLIVK